MLRNEAEEYCEPARVARLAERDASEERQNRQGQVLYHGAEAETTQR
jgi:hypothetical protein